MPDVAANLYSWSTTIGSNSPSGSTAIGTGLDDNLRQIQAVVRGLAASTSIASAATMDIGAVESTFLTVTGTTTITALGTVSAGIYKFLIFSGALTLTHNATSLILPSSTNLTTAAGDVALMLSLGSGNWRCLSYTRASGLTAAAATTFGDGTAAAPSIAFTNDTDCGFYRIGTNQFGAAANGANIATFGVSSVTIPTLTCTTGTVTDLTATTAIATTSVRSPNVGSAAGNFTLNAASDTYNFDQNGGTALKFQQDGQQFAVVGTVASKNFTALSIPGAVGGAQPYQFGVGNHTSDSARNGVWVNDVDMHLSKAMTVWVDSGGNGITVYAESATNAIYIYKSGPNPIWRVDNAGATWADGAYSSGGADYAEAFLFVGERPEPGDTVALAGDKVRLALLGDDIIGVVSSAPAVIGDKSLLDQGGVAVGLMGKLRVNDGCPVSPTWRKLSGDLYLVR